MDDDEDSLIGPVIFEPFLSEHTQEINLGMSKSEISPGTGLLFIYPNPIHQGASIQFTMETEGMVSLDIYNISGSLVRSLLASQHYLPGTHTIPWDGFSGGGRMVPGGVYLVILKSDLKIYSKKIMVVR